MASNSIKLSGNFSGNVANTINYVENGKTTKLDQIDYVENNVRTVVYRRAVMLTNQLNSASSWSRPVDAGWSNYTYTQFTANVINNHKYYCYCVTGTYGGGYSGPGGKWLWSGTNITGQGFYKSGTTGTVAIQYNYQGTTPRGTSSGVNGTFYMFVDITEYEKLLGRDVTVADMNKIGIFYGNKEVAL